MSIIGINGKIGSGKDTVGKIIQWLTKPESDGQYIGFETYDDATLERNSSFKIKKYAGKLKQMASLLTGIPVEKFEDQQFKKTDLPNEWVYVENGYAARNMTVRDFLQKLGTEAMRDGLHTNVWVNALFADYVPRLQFEKSFHGMKGAVPVEEPNWIITDMRFPNEMEAVVERKGITIRVTSPFIRFSDGSYRAKSKMMGDFNNEHPSETSLDDAKFDYEIINDAGISELIEKVRQILTIEKII